jgi:hypothetical protein
LRFAQGQETWGNPQQEIRGEKVSAFSKWPC